MCDFYALSRFSRDPKRRTQLQDELDEAAGLLAEIRAAAPSARIRMFKGNHEERLRKHLWANSPETSGLRTNDIKIQLRLSELGIEYIAAGWMVEHGVIQKHGSYVRKGAGASVQAEMLNTGMPVIMGHVHRLALVPLRMYGRTLVGAECGCLCSPDPEYGECGEIANWHPGLVYGEVERGRSIFRPAFIRDGRVEA